MAARFPKTGSKAFGGPWGMVAQCAVAAACVALLVWLASNVLTNLNRSGLASGFGFLLQPAGFDIAEVFPLPWRTAQGWTVVSYAPSESYLLAFVTGVVNTLKVSVFGIALATCVGVITALAASSPASPFYVLARSFVRVSRNVPLLLQLLLWYAVLMALLPEVSQSLRIGEHVFLNNRGFFLPGPVAAPEGGLDWETPALVFGGRNIRGGLQLTPEFAALTWGLSLYTGSFIAELLRAALESLPQGQRETAAALGLGRWQAFRHVLLPQAIRVAVPPVVSQYLNLMKNTSLAVAIGYPDLVGVGGTVINQSGHALEVILLWMFVFLFFSVATSLAINLWGRHVRAREGR